MTQSKSGKQAHCEECKPDFLPAPAFEDFPGKITCSRLCQFHKAAQMMFTALDAVRVLPGFEQDAPYGKLVLAAIAAAEERDE